jgi:hypothetical protein
MRQLVERGAPGKENVMADRAGATWALRTGSPQAKAPRRIAAVLALAAFALAGCNAGQEPNSSSQRTLAAIYPNYSPYNPIQYAQTSGFYGGR